MKEALLRSPGPRTPREYLILFIKGFAMGVTDLIPGVSGGTIAFITGIYESLLDAIGSLNKKLVTLVLQGEFKEALAQIHLRFLVTLFSAVLLAIFSLARLMHYLMTNYIILTWSLFFGLIAASVIVIYRQLEDPLKWLNTFLMAIGVVVGYVIVSLIPVQTPESYWFLYLCGMISITAMILPGLSGSFLLLILGKYEYVIAAVKNPFGEGQFSILLIFLMGIITGAIGFSRVLNWFLKHYRNETMAFLTGILAGSVKKIWPWKEVLRSEIIGGKERIIQEANIIPEWNSQVLLALMLMLVGFVFVLTVEAYSKDK